MRGKRQPTRPPVVEESSVPDDAAAAAPAAPEGAPAEGAGVAVSGGVEGEAFSLSPERLSVIAGLNSRLAPLADQLATVPVFTVTLGGGTSPLTVPGPDGQKLAYFFFEAVDAASFLRAVVEQTGMELEAGVVGLRLSEVVRAYSSDAAATAKETFVLIPMMSEVAMARKIVKARESALEAAGQAAAHDPDALGATNGLVPVFWSESLAVQTAAGKRRKLLFFKESDLQMMWANLTATRKQAAAAEDDEAKAEAAALPPYPTVHVSDLQAVSLALVEANATEAFLFRPSSNALLDVSRGASASAAAGAATPPAARKPPGVGRMGGGPPGYEAAEAAVEEDAAFEYEPEEEDEEEEEASAAA